MFVEPVAQHFENLELRLRRPIVGVFDGAAKGIERLIQHVRKSEIALRPFHVHLDQLLFHGRHFFGQFIRRSECWLQALVFTESFAQSLDLRLHIANLIDRLMQFADPIHGFRRELELLRHRRLRFLDSRIDQQMQRRRLALAAGR